MLEGLLRAAAAGPPVFERRLAEYEAARRGPAKGRLPDVPLRRLDQFRALAALYSTYDSEPPGFVFDDVYHVAFHKLQWWRSYTRIPLPAEECTRLYRGQRVDEWKLGPSIYRGVAAGPDRLTDLRRRAATACRMGRAVARRLGMSFPNAMAVAQHFSAADELGEPTWLIDFTRDPWVGLFFASDGGATGTCGIVWNISRSEWTSHAAGPGNPIGPLQLTVPRGILRIDGQAGVFVTAAHPAFFEQYVPFGADTRFRQHTGLTFEDPVLGITRDTIYPKDDPVRALLREIRAAADGCACDSGADHCEVPRSFFADPAEATTYADLLACWLAELDRWRGGDALPPVLLALAEFHARLHSPAYASRLTTIVTRSLNRLRHAFDYLSLRARDGKPLSVRDAVWASYVSQAVPDDADVAALTAALDEIAPRDHQPEDADPPAGEDFGPRLSAPR